MPDEIKLNSAVVIIEHLLTTLYLLDKTISSRIETMIVEYHNFEDLINYQISALKKNDEADLKTILGKSIRRITSENLNTFQEKLYGRIRKGEYENLNLGSITKEKKGEDFIDVQNYVKTNDSKYDFLGIKLKRHNRR